MATKVVTEQRYDGNQSVGVAVLVACGMLSLISVLGMFIILGVSVVRSRRSSDHKLFVRTHVAMYFFCLLFCDLFQGIGALLNIPWIVDKRAYVGSVCTAQATIKQFGNVGTAIFSFVIAAHTFSLLFLRRQWSGRTCYIVLIASWGLLVFDLCIGNYVVADKRRGPYYGISGYWCWITPAYPTERYTTEYLFMFTSAGFSFALYLLIFFKLRGNITLDGYKVRFQKRPKVRVGRTAAGTYIMTDDRRVESHLTTVAKQMLWYPIAYTVLVLPIAAARFSTFTGASVPFPVTIFTAAVFMLTGFVNAVLFGLTRNVLPGTWKQRFGFGSTIDSRGVTSGQTSRTTNATWRGAAPTRVGTMGTVSTGASHVVLNVGVEKAVEIKYDDPDSLPSFLKVGSSPTPPSPPSPRRGYPGGGQQPDTYNYYVQGRSIPSPRSGRRSIRIEGDEEAYRGAATSRPNTTEREVLHHQGHPYSGIESAVYRPAPDLEAPASFHPFAMATPVHTETQRARPSSILVIGNPIHPSQVPGWDSEDNINSGMHWTGPHQ